MAGAKDTSLFPDNECRLVLIGKTGSGKSSTGNSILGRQAFKSQIGMNSETKQCGRETVKRNDVLISVMDTPGLSDTDEENNVIAERITKSLLAAGPGPHAILLVLRCDCRFTEEEVQVYKALKDIFGDNMTGYLIVIFVGKDRLTSGPTFEQQLEKAHRLQIILREAGNRYILFSNKARGKERDEQVDKLLELVREVMRTNQRTCFRFRMAEELNNTMKAMVIEEINHLKGDELKIKLSEALEADNKENASVPVHRREIKDLEKRREVRSAQAMFEQRAKVDCGVQLRAGKGEGAVPNKRILPPETCRMRSKTPPPLPPQNKNLVVRSPLPLRHGYQEDAKGYMQEKGGVKFPHRAMKAKQFQPETGIGTSQSRSKDFEISPPLPPRTTKTVPRLATPCTDAKHQDTKSLSEFMHEHILKERLLKLIENGGLEDGVKLSSLVLVRDLVLQKILMDEKELTSVQKRRLKDAERVVDREVKIGMKRHNVKNLSKCVLM